MHMVTVHRSISTYHSMSSLSIGDGQASERGKLRYLLGYISFRVSFLEK